MIDSAPLTKKFQKEMNAGIASLVLLSGLQKSRRQFKDLLLFDLLKSKAPDTHAEKDHGKPKQDCCLRQYILQSAAA